MIIVLFLSLVLRWLCLSDDDPALDWHTKKRTWNFIHILTLFYKKPSDSDENVEMYGWGNRNNDR